MADITDADGFTLFDHDRETGRTIWMKPEDGKYVFRIDQPLETIFTANHEAAMATQGQRFGDWNRVASIPHHLAHQNGLSQAVEQQDDRFIAKVLNDSDNLKFRTSRGRV